MYAVVYYFVRYSEIVRVWRVWRTSAEYSRRLHKTIISFDLALHSNGWHYENDGVDGTPAIGSRDD